jgi:hypothetical protein
MTSVKGIGQQFLWCDALCLLQNDPDDVRRADNVMDMIYENALLTTVAAYGHDANGAAPWSRRGITVHAEISRGDYSWCTT